MTMDWEQIQWVPVTRPIGDTSLWVEEDPGTMSTGGWPQPTLLPIPPPPIWPTLSYDPAGLNPSVWDVVDVSATAWPLPPTTPPLPIRPTYFYPSVFSQIVVESIDVLEVELPWWRVDPGVRVDPYAYPRPVSYAQINPTDFIEPTYDPASMVWWRDAVLTRPIEYRHRLPSSHHMVSVFTTDPRTEFRGGPRDLFHANQRVLRGSALIVREAAPNG